MASKYLLVESRKIASRRLYCTPTNPPRWKYPRRVRSIKNKRSRYIPHPVESSYPRVTNLPRYVIVSSRCSGTELISSCRVLTNIQGVTTEVFWPRWPSRIGPVGWTSNLTWGPRGFGADYFPNRAFGIGTKCIFCKWLLGCWLKKKKQRCFWNRKY